MQQTTVFDCQMLSLPKNHREQGNLTVVTNEVDVSFTIKRVYYLYDVPGGYSRGGHGHKELKQLVVALSGSFSITVDDGTSKQTFHLSRPDRGLMLPPGLWRELDNFSSGSICMVLASELYDENDYFRDYEKFVAWKSAK
jgi:dTDP-4-dehydrorhamnose 3,5-epimerase-like enzyme